MCQLLGMNCNVPTDVTFSFTGFAQRGGKTDHHSDGWGIAFFEDKGLRHFVDHQAAVESPVAELIRRYPIKSKNVIAHIRKATQGVVNLQNCHPFVRELWGRYWVFAHNGDLKDFRPRLHSHFRPVGDTDSEHAFCWIMQELAKSHASVPSVPELTLTLKELAARISPYGTFNHRHQPEISHHLGKEVLFQPHLGNYVRGILATIYVQLADGVTPTQVDQAFLKAYEGKPLVRLTGQMPSIRGVASTPYCDIAWQQQGNMLVVVSAIDNLLKGAASQAMQCINIKFGFEPATGLI